MVVLATVGNRFEADMLAAKLGANGILWQVRSRQLIATTHPIGSIDVLVPSEELFTAQQLIEPDDDWDGPSPRRSMPAHLRLLQIGLAAAFVLPLCVVLFLWLQDVLDIVH